MTAARLAAAEFFGTFWLVLGGCGTAVLAAKFPELGVGFLGVALAFGLSVMTGALGREAARSRARSIRLVQAWQLRRR